MNALRTIRLGGVLGKQFGRYHRLAVQSVAEAVVALNALHPGFNQAIRRLEAAGRRFRVTVAQRDVTEQELVLVSRGDILIMPLLAGAGGNNSILGGVLIVVGALMYAYGGQAVMMAGVGMMASGAMMLLTPVPKADAGQMERDAGKQSYLFNGAANSSAQGMAAPVGVGLHRVGGIIVSAGISVEDL